MRITKSWLKQAKSRIILRVGEVASIYDVGGVEALGKEYKRLYPYSDVDVRGVSASQLMRLLISHYVEFTLPATITD